MISQGVLDQGNRHTGDVMLGVSQESFPRVYPVRGLDLGLLARRQGGSGA